MRLPAFVCLPVCLLARLLKTRAYIWMKCCASTDVGTWTNWLTFKPNLDAGTALLSPLSYKRCYAEFYVGKIRRIGRCSEAWFKMVLRPTAAATRGFTMVLFTVPVSRRNTFVGGTCAPQSAFLVCHTSPTNKLYQNSKYIQKLHTVYLKLYKSKL